MSRLSQIAVGILCVALGLSGCGSSKSNSSAASTNTTAGSTVTIAASSAKALPSVCSLPTPAQLNAVLLAAPAGSGTALDYEPTYKTCSWNVVPPGSANSNALRVGVVVKTKPTDKGFGAPSQVGNPVAVSGAGDAAILYSTSGSSGITEAVLVASKGSVSVSLNATYSGKTQGLDAIKAALVDLANGLFGQIQT